MQHYTRGFKRVALCLPTGGGKLRRLAEVMTVMGQAVAWAQLRSSGRNGSAIADELIDFGRRGDWQPALLDLSAQCEEQVEQDWQQYAKAFDQGAFKPLK